MNNTIEALEEIKKYYAQDIIRGTETGSKRFKAIEKAISNEKVLEIAGDMLPSYESGGRADEDIPDDKEHAYSLGYGDGQIDYKHKAEPVLAKQILKVKELEAEAKLGNIPYKEAIALKAENKELKEQQLTVDTIEKVFDKHTIIANSDILYRKDLAIAIIKAREAKQHRTCDPECPFYKTEEASK